MQPLHDNKQWILHVTATRIAAFRDEQEVYDAISEYIHSPYISESSLFSFVPDIRALAESIPGSPLFEETLDLWYGLHAGDPGLPPEEEVLLGYQLYLTLHVIRNNWL